jgi:hypothetical protein
MKSLLVVVFISCTIFSCNNAKKELDEKTPTVKAANNAVDKLVNDYLALKDAFISNDTTKINQATQIFVSSTNIDTALLGDIVVTNKADLKKNAIFLSETLLKLEKGKTIPEKLKIFKDLTKDVKPIAVLTHSQNLYVQNCPMATDYSDNDSVFWISNQPKIRNPFYPRTMPGCGVIIDTLVVVK